MKNLVLGTVLAICFLIALEANAEAQGVSLEYKKRTSNSELIVGWSSGGYWGCSYGYGHGHGYGIGSSYVFRGAGVYGPVLRSPAYLYPRISYDAYFHGSRPVYNYAPVYSTPGTDNARMTSISARKEVEEGLRSFRKGHYSAALASFKKAYLAETDSAAIQLYFGLALVGTGDLRNASKAFSIALENLSIEDLQEGFDLSSMFGSVRQQGEYRKISIGSDPNNLSAGVIAFLFGEEARAKGILDSQKKNAAARKLLRSYKP